MSTINLGDNGFIFKTGQDLKAKKNLGLKMYYYAPDLALIWEKDIEKTKANNIIVKDFIFASPTGNYVNHVEIVANLITNNKSEYVLTQIERDGKTKMHSITINSWGSLQVAFANDQYSFFLTSTGGELADPSARSRIRLDLHRVENGTFKQKDIHLNLPRQRDYRNTSFWSYVGQTDSHFFMCKRTIDLNNGSTTYTVLKFDNDGNVVKETNIQLPLDGYYPRPSANTMMTGGAYYFMHKHLDFNARFTKNPFYCESAQIDAYGDLYIDPENDKMYVFGLFGENSAEPDDFDYSGYYVFRYDMDGTLETQLLEHVKGMYENDKDFAKTESYGRYLIFVPHADNQVSLYIEVGSNFQLIQLDEDGDQLGFKEYERIYRVTDLKLRMFTYQGPSPALNRVKNFNKKEYKNYEFWYSSGTNSEILLVKSIFRSECEVWQFDNK